MEEEHSETNEEIDNAAMNLLSLGLELTPLEIETTETLLQLINLKPKSQSKPITRVSPAMARPIRLPECGISIDGSTLPRYPPVLMDLIGTCSKPFEKQITPSDVEITQCRLSFNKTFVTKEWLPMLKPKENVVVGVPVTVYGPDEKEHKMSFNFWSKKMYCVNKGWKSFFVAYKLQACTHWATVWMFRHKENDGLCFVITWKYIYDTKTLIIGRKKKSY